MSSLRLHGFQSRLLAPIDLVLPAGHCMTLTGPSGSGKSLLLRAIADLDPHQGEAFVDELAQSQLPPTEWRRRVALLPAESHWWGNHVEQHIAPDSAELLHFLGFSSDTLTWEPSRLSSGERQRLALVRLLAGRPSVLLLDEPTANLDQENTGKVEQLIGDYLRETQAAVLWVSHDPAQRKRVALEGWEIADGRIVADPWS